MSRDRWLTVWAWLSVALLAVVLTAFTFTVTGTHIAQCETVNSALEDPPLFGDDPDGEPLTVCWDIITGQRI